MQSESPRTHTSSGHICFHTVCECVCLCVEHCVSCWCFTLTPLSGVFHLQVYLYLCDQLTNMFARLNFSKHSNRCVFTSCTWCIGLYGRLYVMVWFCKTALLISLFIHKSTMFLVAPAFTVWEKSFICWVWCFIKLIQLYKSEKNREVPYLTVCNVCLHEKSAHSRQLFNLSPHAMAKMLHLQVAMFILLK